MLFSLLAALQLQTVWATSASSFDTAVNHEVQKLETLTYGSSKQLNIRDIKTQVFTGTPTYYYAFILYEMIEKEQK